MQDKFNFPDTVSHHFAMEHAVDKIKLIRTRKVASVNVQATLESLSYRLLP